MQLVLHTEIYSSLFNFQKKNTFLNKAPNNYK